MKIVRGVLIVLLTLVWLVILAIQLAGSVSYAQISGVGFVYLLLLYLVWPVGTDYAQAGMERLLFALGMGLCLIILALLLTEDCVLYPTQAMIIQYPKQSGYFALAHWVCLHLGRLPAALMLSVPAGYFFYLGHRFRLNRKRPNAIP